MPGPPGKKGPQVEVARRQIDSEKVWDLHELMRSAWHGELPGLMLVRLGPQTAMDACIAPIRVAVSPTM